MPWLTLLLNLAFPSMLGILLFINHRRQSKLRLERDKLLQEKEASLGFVHHVGEVFANAETVDMDLLLDRALHYAMRTCEASSGAIHLANRKTDLLEARSVSGAFPPPFELHPEQLDLGHDATALLEKLVRKTPIPLGTGLIGEVSVKGNPVLVEDAEKDPRVCQLPFDFLKIRTLLMIPMRFGNHTIGVMTLVNRTNGGRFSMADLNLAQALAAQASVLIHYASLQEVLEEKRQMDRDMQIARQIQLSLLPNELPAFPTLEIAAFNLPAMEIGGDYYDFIAIDDKHIGLAIADVSGKGIGGALTMAVCRNVLRVNAANEYDPSSMLRFLNKNLGGNLADDMFISVLYMVLNLETNLLSYARAGHEAPIIVRNGNPAAERTQTAGIAIGLVDDETFAGIIETRNITLHPGDVVATYTGGITEAMDSEGAEWGLENLVRAVEESAGSSARDLVEDIRNKVLAFIGDNRQSDDMTLLAFKIK